jgi:putative ABC transport system permease protein
MAKSLGIAENPIGKQIDFGYRQNLKVVGVVKDYFIDGVDSKVGDMFLFHWEMFPWMNQNFSNIQFKLSGNNTPETMAEIEKFWKQNIEQGYPFSYRFINEQFARTYKRFQNQQTLFSILTLIVIWVSLLGLFALATLSIQQRLKEVAIRKTLGASEYKIVSQLVKSFVKVVLFSSVILIPLAFYVMQDWLDNFVYRIEMPYWPYILTPVVLILLVLLVVGIKAFNATKVDLIKYLKFE